MTTAAEHVAAPDGARAERRPLLAPWWRAVEDGDRLLFEHGGHVVELNGRAVRTLLPALVPLLDGAHTVPEIVETLGAATQEPVTKALALLDAHGLLVDGPPSDGDAACYVASVCATTPAAASGALQSSRVGLFGSGPGRAELSHLLRSAGAEPVPWTSENTTRPRVDLIVAAPAAEEANQLERLNAQCLRDATPWLVLLPTNGRFAAVGPLYLPGQTACHACYLLRRGATSGFEEDFPLLERQPVRAAMPPGANTITAGLGALLCLRWLGARDPTLPGAFYALELQGTLALTRHRVLRVPRCPACGIPSPPPSPWFREPDA